MKTGKWNLRKESESESCSVLSNSLWPHGLCSLPGSSAHGILQARTLEWVVPFPRGSSQPRNQTQVSHIAGRFSTICATREAWSLRKRELYNENVPEICIEYSWFCCWILRSMYIGKIPTSLGRKRAETIK